MMNLIKNIVVLATLFIFILLTLAFTQDNYSSGYLEEMCLEDYLRTAGQEHSTILVDFYQAGISELQDKIEALQTASDIEGSKDAFKAKHERIEEKIAALNDIFPEGLAAKLEQGSRSRRIFGSEKNGKTLGLKSFLKAL